VATYLDRILEEHRMSAREDLRKLDQLVEDARSVPESRGFVVAVQGRPQGEPAVIAEIKRRSPSKGDLIGDLDPAQVAVEYADGGATCLSVLTDWNFFGGSAIDLKAAREVVDLPVLRKDFTVDARDVCDSRIMGADAVLLIAAALDDAELADFQALASDLGIDALVEVHDEFELERALAVGANLVGVNQRDLMTFEVDTNRALRMASTMPEGVVLVAESGVRGASDARALFEAGYDALLVGESVVVASDRSSAVRSLRQCAQMG